MLSTLVDRARSMSGKKKWMKAAFSNSHGQFKEKAERGGESTAEFAKENEHSPGKLGKQARLAEVGMKAHHKGHVGASRLKKSMYGSKG